MQVIQAITIPLELSADNGATWQTLVCIDSHDTPMETQITKTNTFCGVAVGLGPIQFDPSGTAICSIDDDPTQVSLKDMQAWQVAQKVLKFRVQDVSNPGSIGSRVYLSGNCYVTTCSPTFKADDVVKFSFKLTGLGTPNIIPGT